MAEQSGNPRIVVLAGDGIGPEIVGAARLLLDRIGTFDYEEQPIGGVVDRRARQPADRRRPDRLQGGRRRPARCGRRPEVGYDGSRRPAARAGVARPAQGPRPVREPAAGQAAGCPDRCEPAAPRADRGHRPPGRARAHRRDLFRPQGPATGLGTRRMRLHERRGDPDRPYGLRGRRAPGRRRRRGAGHLGRQGQRARDLTPVARGDHADWPANTRKSPSTTCSSTTPPCSSSPTPPSST